MSSSFISENIKNRLCVIITNYGDDSLALIQWALDSPFFKTHRANHQLKVISVDTHFAAECWQERVLKARAFIINAGLESVHLNAPVSFTEAILGRGSFPTPKFQWCSTVLKALPILDWLDEVDPACRTVIVSAKRRETLLEPYHALPEWSEKSEHFNDRSLWHPILEMDERTRDSLLKHIGFTPLKHRSLECHPCVNSHPKTLATLTEKESERVRFLENTLTMPMFEPENFAGAKTIDEVVEISKKSQDDQEQKNRILFKKNGGGKNLADLSEISLFYRGCGNPYGCGI